MISLEKVTAAVLRFAVRRVASVFSDSPSQGQSGTVRRSLNAAAAIALSALVAIPASADVTATTTSSDVIACATPSSNIAEGNPARVFVVDNYAFVLEQWHHRIAVYDLEGKTNLFYFGATAVNGTGVKYTDSALSKNSNADGGFKKPFGMALDKSGGGEIRFAVADFGNNRVQLFTFDQGAQEINFVASSGALFDEPNAVAFTESGDVLVADTGNCRVVRLDGSLSQTATYPLGSKAMPTGICSDSDTSEGFWITDSRNARLAYYRIADGTDAPVASFGTTAGKELVTPRDVQIFGDSPEGKYLCVVDNQLGSVRVVEAVMNGGAYSDILLAGDIGASNDASLQEFEKVWRPNGAFVDGDTVYVADYGRNLVKWYSIEVEPPEPPKYFTVTSVELFDEQDNLSTTFTNHQPIRLLVTFDTDDVISKAAIETFGNGVPWKGIPSANVTVSGDTISYANIANMSNTQPYYGPIDIAITASGASGTYTTNIVAAYTLVSAEPAEEYDETPWDFTAITVTNAIGSLAWSFPSSGVPSSGECSFRIEYRASLATGSWATLEEGLTATSAAGCAIDVPLAPLGNPPSCFFRLVWTNKVKE